VYLPNINTSANRRERERYTDHSSNTNPVRDKLRSLEPITNEAPDGSNYNDPTTTNPTPVVACVRLGYGPSSTVVSAPRINPGGMVLQV
jgi:hypothetical protein